MQDGNMRYAPLKNYVCREGGIRLSINGGLRDRLVEWAVEEFPDDAPQGKAAEVLAARLRIRARKEYGSVVLAIFIGVMIRLIANLIVEWFFMSRSNRGAMVVWMESARAEKAKDV